MEEQVGSALHVVLLKSNGRDFSGHGTWTNEIELNHISKSLWLIANAAEYTNLSNISVLEGIQVS